jgi:hypothetical protein
MQMLLGSLSDPSIKAALIIALATILSAHIARRPVRPKRNRRPHR